MRQVVHVLRKDCRHLWPTICAVLALIALHAYGDATSRGGSTGVAIGLSPFAVLYILAALSGVLLVFALPLLVASVVQQEAAVGTEQFWLTRPYRRVSLIVEKLVFLALFISLPLLLHDIAVLRYLHFSLSAAASLLLWKQAQLWVFLLIAATIAVLTRSLAQFALAAIGTILLGLCLLYGLAASKQSLLTDQLQAVVYLGFALLLLFGIAGLVLITYQYLRRRTKFAIILAMAFLFAGFMLARWWPLSLTAYLENRSAPRKLENVQLRLNPQLQIPAGWLDSRASSEPKPDFLLPFEASGLPDDVGVMLSKSAAKLESPSYQPIPASLTTYVRFQPRASNDQFFDPSGPEELVPFLLDHGRAFSDVAEKEGSFRGRLFLDGYRASRVSMNLNPGTVSRQPVDIGEEHCWLTSIVREKKADVSLSCVGLEPSRISNLQAKIAPIPPSGSSSRSSSQSGGQGTWPAFFTPVTWTTASWQFEHVPRLQEQPEPARDRRLDIYMEEALGSVIRDFQVEHFRPAEYDWAAWQHRGAQITPETDKP